MSAGKASLADPRGATIREERPAVVRRAVFSILKGSIRSFRLESGTATPAESDNSTVHLGVGRCQSRLGRVGFSEIEPAAVSRISSPVQALSVVAETAIVAMHFGDRVATVRAPVLICVVSSHERSPVCRGIATYTGSGISALVRYFMLCAPTSTRVEAGTYKVRPDFNTIMDNIFYD